VTPESRLLTIRNAVQDYLRGIERTATVFPLGALHLGASLIDALARLSCDKKGDQARYERFLQDYFPPEYAGNDLPTRLHQGLRNLGLHNLSVGPSLALMDGQMDRLTHLKLDNEDRTIIRLEEFLRDLRFAVTSWERSLQKDEALRRRVIERERRKPVFEIVMIEVLVRGAVTMTTASAGTTTTVAASAAVQPGRSESQPQPPYK
jgi:hypothetical protein